MKTRFQGNSQKRPPLTINLVTITALLLLLTPLAIAAHAQDDQAGAQINVRVADPQGAIVARAEVTLYTRDNRVRIASLTDSNGSCSFKRLAPGEYLIKAEAPGFAPAAAQSLRVERGAATALEISLPLAGVNEEVVITAQGTAQPVDEVSKAITVVDQKEIDDRDESTIADALRTVPGLRVQQLGGPGSFTSIKTRGLRNEDTAVLIDGLRFRDAAAITGDASGFLEDLIVTDVSQVEVLRGSGSSLYGTNAIGGVINLVTDEGGGPFHGSLLGEGGGLGMFRGRAQFAGGTRNNGIVYSAGFSHLNVSRGVDDQDEARITSGQGRVLFHLSPTTTLSGRVYAVNSRLQLNNSPQAIGTLPTGIIEAIPLSIEEQRRYEAGVPISQLNVGAATFIAGANDPDNLRKANFFSGAIVFTQRPTEAFSYTISYQGLATNRSTINGPLGVGFQPFGGSEQSDFHARIQTFNARFDLRAGDANLISGGYEFEHENFKNSSFPVDPTANSNVVATQTSHTLFVQDQLRLLDDRLQISAAFRTQFFRLRQPVFTPAASSPYAGLTFLSPPTAYTGDGSIAYIFRSTGTKLRAHVGNGYRAPSLYERFGSFFDSFFGFSPIGDPRLRPDRSIAFDAGIDQTLYKNRLRASATYFYTRLQEVITFDFSGAINPVTDPFGRFGGYRNSNGGIARGLELSLTAAATRTLNASASYTYTKSLQRTPQVPGVLRSLVIPDHQFSLVVTQRFGRRVLVNFDLAASSDYLAPISQGFSSRAYRFPGLVKADLGASYTLPLSESRSLRFFGYVDNLFDRDNFESGFRTPGRTGRAGASFSF